jgi:hypothetical protein
MRTHTGRQEEWAVLIADHRAALDAFLARVASLEPAIWSSPRAEDKWSPAEVSEHLRLTYSTLLAELQEKGGFRIRTRWWQRQLLRLFYLPGILRTGRMGRLAPAPREIRPADAAYDQSSTLDHLRREGHAFLQALGATDLSTFKGLTHPFFGRLAPLEMLRVVTIHVRHHHEQVKSVTGTASGTVIAP